MPRISPQPMVSHLRAHLPIAAEGVDPEGVHQVRVAAQRLRVWCRLAKRKGVRRELSWLRDQSGQLRDIDVFLLDHPPPVLAAWLHHRWSELRPDLLAALGSPRLASLIDELDGLAPLPRARAHSGLSRIATKTLRRGRAAELDPSPERLHDLRRAVRQVRYTLEWAGSPSREVKAVQTALGRYNDLVVQERLVVRSGLGPELGQWLAQLERDKGDAEQRARAAWVARQESFERLATGADHG